MYFLLKYGVQADIEFAMVKRGVVDLAATADWTPATGDTKIIKDGASATNTQNNPAAIGGTGSVGWKLTLTAAELQCARLQIQIVDSATKAVEDQFITVYTFGNAAAKFPFDFSDLVRGGLTALPNANAEAAGGLYTRGTGAGQINQDANGRIDARDVAMAADVLTSSALAASAVTEIQTGLATSSAQTTLQSDIDDIQARLVTIRSGICQDSTASNLITLDAGASSQNGFYGGAVITIVSGTAAGQSRLIVGYNGTTKVVTLASSLEVQPDSASGFVITPGATDLQAWLRVVPNALIGQRVNVDVGAISTDATAADNAEAFFDGTGYAGTGNTIPTVTSVTNRVTANTDQIEGVDATNQIRDAIVSDATRFAGADVAAIKAKTDNLPQGIKKNTAFTGFTFVMTDSTTHGPKTGLVNGDFTKQVSLDGGAASALSGTITEVDAGDFPGLYKINLTAGELNGNSVSLRFAATGADETQLVIATNA